MAAELIGRCRCPLCNSDKARLSLSTKKLACLVCNACNLQVFARSDNSDMRLRGLLIAEPVEAVPAATPTPASAAAAAPAKPASPDPEKPAPPPRPAWGFGSF